MTRILALRADPCKTLLDWPSRAFRRFFQNWLYYLRKYISVSGLAECAGCAFEAPDDFTISF